MRILRKNQIFRRRNLCCSAKKKLLTSVSLPSIFSTRKMAATPASSRWLGAAVAVAAVAVAAVVAAAVVVAVAVAAVAARAVRLGAIAGSAEPRQPLIAQPIRRFIGRARLSTRPIHVHLRCSPCRLHMPATSKCLPIRSKKSWRAVMDITAENLAMRQCSSSVRQF